MSALWQQISQARVLVFAYSHAPTVRNLEALLAALDAARELAAEAEPDTAAGAGVGLTPEQRDRLLAECLKPEEIAGPRREARIAELLRWFVRFASGDANPKWLRGHAFELAYALVTPPAPRAGAEAFLREQYVLTPEGARVLEEERASLAAEETAVVHIFRQVLANPRLAWYIGPASESLALLMAAYAAITGTTSEAVAAEYGPQIRTEAPRCSACPAPAEKEVGC